MAATRSPRTRQVADLSPEVEWYLEQRGYTLPDWCRPKFRSPEPRNVKGAEFHPDRVDRVIAALRCLRHTQGKWRGQPLEPSAWQVAYVIAPVFGWVRWDAAADDYVRIIRTLYVDIPRKGGKTTLSSGLALYLCFADGEGGAQVYAAAASKDQASKCFDPAALIVRHSPEMKEAGVRPLRTQIRRDADGSYFAVASSLGDLLHGANPHGAVIDELHVHKNPDVVDALESGTGARQQPLIIIITTPDDGRQGTVYANKREYAEKLCRRVLKDESTYAVIFGAEETDDPFVEATWMKANPGYGVTPTKAFLESEARKAQNNPVDLARFKRLHLGLRTKQETKYVEIPVWDRNAGMVDEAALKGCTVFGGLDLASTSDLCSLCWDFPADDGSHDVLWRHWCPETAYDKLNERTAGAAAVWRREGWLTVTPGDVADYDYIRAQINRDREAFAVQAIGFDRWNASQLVNDLMADEAPMVQVGQGFASMSAPLKQINHLLLEGTAKAPRYRHGANPLMRWQIDNLAVGMDPAGNVKPDKKRSGDKIDGISAAVNAMAMAMTVEAPKRSKYETDDLLVV